MPTGSRNPVVRHRLVVGLTAMLATLAATFAAGRDTAAGGSTARGGSATHSSAATVSHNGVAHSTFSYSTGDRDHFAWGIADPGSHDTFFMGDDDEWSAINALLENDDQELFWFRLENRAYVVRDAGFIKRARTLVEPMTEMGRRQGEWGRQQGVYGAEQGRLGAQQARLSMRLARIEQRFAALESQLDDNARDDPGLNAMREELQQNRRELSRLQSELGRQQSELGRQQSEIGARQSELGRRQESLAREIGVKVEALAREAIAQGKAERLAN